MTNRGVPPSGTGNDPMAQLNAAMAETVTELDQTGSGVAPNDVIREAPPGPAPRRERRAPRPERDERDADPVERRAPRENRSGRTRQPADAAEMPDPARVILDEADQESEPEERPRRQRREQPEASPQRDERGRFLPSRTATDAADDDDDDLDDDADDDEDDDDARAADGRRYAEPEEADVEDDDDEPEGRTRAEDDEDEDEDAPRERRGRRRIPRAMQREIDRRVASQVSQVIEERDKLREIERTRQGTEAEAIDFLFKAIGTQEQRDQLQGTVNNTRLPLEQRNHAAATLGRYLSNEKYVRTYRTALLATIRQESATSQQKVVSDLAKYQIKLNPAIVAEGDANKLLVHAVREAILFERRRNQAELERMRRRVATRRGVEDERAVSNGRFGRSSMASSNGRRSNGRVATVDRLRGALDNERGIGSNSVVAMPTDRVLQQLRDGEITLADLGLSQN